MAKAKNIQQITLTAVCVAVLAACGGGGGSSGSPNTSSTDTGAYVEEAKAANKVRLQIEAIGAADTLEVGDVAAVQRAVDAFNNLNDLEKNLVPLASRNALKAMVTTINTNAQTAENIAEQFSKLPATADTEAEKAQAAGVAAAYNALSDAQKTWFSATLKARLDALSQDTAPDSGNGSTSGSNDSLPPLNLPTPLHTSFISSNTAQQHNPHMQLRLVDGQPALLDTQIGLIRSLILVKNDQVILDGAVLSSNNELGYLTPYSASTKASSAGNTEENISSMVGKRNGVYSDVKTSLDKEILDENQALAAAWKILEDPEAKIEAVVEARKTIVSFRPAYNESFDYGKILSVDPNEQKEQQKIKEEIEMVWREYEGADNKDLAWSKVEKLKPLYSKDITRRIKFEKDVDVILKDLAYIKKDKNGLVFDKAFDGVYVIQFENGTEVVIHDSAAAGWTYQTFAHYIDPNNGVLRGYQSLGDETTVAQMPVSGTATYTGITTAYLNKQQVTAKVNAVADFAKKGVRFTTSDSQIHTLNGNVRTSTAADRLNMSGTASWAAGENAFKGNVATADKALSGTFNGKFYGGASVAEIGGTYGLKNADNSEQLIGGYGAKRQ
jgi:hypothetical protein